MMREDVATIAPAAVNDPTERLLAHLALLEKLLGPARPPAAQRLEATVGRELLERLLGPRD